MLDNYQVSKPNIYNNMKINAVSGAIIKNHQKSWFRNFSLKSDLAKKYLTHEGHKKGMYDDGVDDVIILQMVICGDMEVIAECIYKKDLKGAQPHD